MIDVKSLIQPISGSQPTGQDLRLDTSLDSLFYQAKDARQAARQIERRVLLNPALEERADWQHVVTLCSDILSTHSKDMEVVTWLIEGLLRTDGLKGLRTGFDVLTQLIQHYWETLYPESNDIADRVMSITSLNGEDYDGTLIQPLYQVAVTRDSGQGCYVVWQYQQAMENANKYFDNATIVKKREEGLVFLEDIHTAVAQSGAEFYQQLQQDMFDAKLAFEKLHNVLVEKCGADAPPSSQILAALTEVSDHIRFLINDAPFTVHEVVDVVASLPNEESDMKVQATVDATPKTAIPLTDDITDRKQALSYLQKIAAFFRQTEPQSPLPHLLDRAVRWGNMPFAELLKEIIKDEGVRANAYELMGLETVKTTNEVEHEYQ